jgi:flavin-dependent dehydrogenase
MSVPAAPEILVVGLGPAGSRAAAMAAAAGCPVLAIDRRRRPGHPVQCAEFVPAMLGQEIDAVGPATRQRIRAMITFVEDAAGEVTEDFPGRMIDRAAFDRALTDAAVAAGARCRFGVVLEDLAEDGTARLSDGTVVRPRLVIGADGPRSAVGQAIGQVNRALVETRQVTVPLKAPHGEAANLGVGVVPEARHRLKSLLDRLHRVLVAEGRVGREILRHTGGPIPVGGARRPRGALGEVPVLLAGDAVGLTNPVTGAGIASAVISGSLAGRAAADWLAGDGAALDDYTDEVAALFGSALDRALRRRREILACYETGGAPSPPALRRGWIAYPEYWAA